MRIIQYFVFFLGIIVFSYGIATAIQVQHLGIHPWEVLSIALYQQAGFTIGTWNIVVGVLLVIITGFIDKSYISIGTFMNALLVGPLVDLFLLLDVFVVSINIATDIAILAVGILLMGIGGGVYSAAGLGAGPRDGFMLSIADKLNMSISKVRIITESSALVVGLILGGPVFFFTFIYTFLQSPIYQVIYGRTKHYIAHASNNYGQHKKAV